MALRNILTDEDPTLFKVSRPVTSFDERLHILLDDMRETLIDAMNHPAGYESMVVRVSGFSAYYTALGRDVQEDILKRTEHE